MTSVDPHATGGLIPYRPGLDGLRGLAVTAVLVFHGGFTWFAGGFLGVSVFFTLSGFLITSLLVAEHQANGHIDLRRFWSRRFRRLLPASLVALGGIGLFGLTVATAEQAERLAGDVGAALAYVANWRFVLGETSYAELWGEPSPVLHFWSLAIEEQFYLVLPPLVVATLLLSRGRRGVLAAVLGVLTLGSIAATLALGTSDLDRIYFGTDTRAAELLAGSLLAVGVAMAGSRLRERAGWLLTIASTAALGALAGLVVLVDARTLWLYQGGLPAIALLSVVAIYGATREGPLARALGTRPLHWLGTRSYGIYLFHWPVFLWLDPGTIGVDGVPLFAVRLAVTFAIAEASFQFVEAPIRYGRALRRSALVVAPQATAVVLAVAFAATVSAPAPLVQISQTVDRIPPPPTVVTTVPPAAVATETVSAAPTTASYVLLGDTFAALLGDELEAALERRAGVDLLDATHPHCAWYEVVVGTASSSCGGLVQAWEAATTRAELVVISLGAGGTALPARGPVDAALLDASVRDLRSRVPDTAEVVWVLQPLVLEPGDPRPNTFDPAESAWPALAQLSGSITVVAADRGDQVIDLATYLQPDERNGDRAATIVEHDSNLVPMGLGWVADQLSRPRVTSGTIRLLVVGDSVAYNLGRGIERIAAGRSDLVVWNAGTTGCGIVRGGEMPMHEFQPSPVCDLWPDRFESHLQEFDPHLVLVISAGWDLIQRRLPHWDEFKRPGDPVFDAYLRHEYEFVLEVLTNQGASVAWGITPCVSDEHATGSVFAPDRKVHQVRVLEALAAEHVGLRLVDLDPLACPGGRFTNTIGGISNFRPDGVHYSDEGAVWMASRLVPMLLEPWSPGVDAWAAWG